MITSPENIILMGSLLLLVSIVAGKTSGRFGVPTLILFVVVGVLAGSEGIGGIYFDNPHIAQFIGIIALNFILFSGGLETEGKTIREVMWKGISLSVIGVLVTALAVGAFVHFILHFTWLEGCLVGAVVSATDAAAVFSILRSKGIKLKGKMGAVLELESGSNDPMAYFLTASLTTAIATHDLNGWQLILLFVKSFLIGGAMGYSMGRLSVVIINKINLQTDGLYPVLVLGLAMFTYAATQLLGGNGFLAIYLSALILGNSDFIHKRSLLKFYEGQAWLMQITLFLTLGLLVFPSKIIPVIGTGLLIAAFLMLVARPLGVWMALSFFKTSFRSKMFMAWVGLRGGVPIVFATYPLIAGLDKAGLIFNLVFFISISSVLVQGTTLPLMAKWLGVVEPPVTADIKHTEETTTAEDVKEVVVEKEAEAMGKKIVDLHLPSSVHIIAIKRQGDYLQPAGSTRLLEGDRLLLISTDKDELQEAIELF